MKCKCDHDVKHHVHTTVGVKGCRLCGCEHYKRSDDAVALVFDSGKLHARGRGDAYHTLCGHSQLCMPRPKPGGRVTCKHCLRIIGNIERPYRAAQGDA